jgi:cytochrome P450
VVPLSFREFAGFPPMDSAGSPQWTTLSYNAAAKVLEDDGSTFSVRAYAATHDAKMGAATILSMDEPIHRAHRRLISTGFFAENVRRASEKKVFSVINQLLDRIQRNPEGVDLVRDFTSVLPIQVIVSLVGVDDEDWPQFLAWVDDLVEILADRDAAMKAGAQVQKYLEALVAKRRREPKDDLASALAVAELDGERLSDPAIVAFLAVLLTAGGETTVRVIGTTLLGLLSDRPQFEALVADRNLIPRALDEGLRWDTPVQVISRKTTRDVELAGVQLAAGDWINVHLGAANRDPSRWEHPDRFDIHRPFTPHISFGRGPHTCIGLNLARFEAETALNLIIERLPGLRLARNGRESRVCGIDLRGPQSLDVEFDPIFERA